MNDYKNHDAIINEWDIILDKLDRMSALCGFNKTQTEDLRESVANEFNKIYEYSESDEIEGGYVRA